MVVPRLASSNGSTAPPADTHSSAGHSSWSPSANDSDSGVAERADTAQAAPFAASLDGALSTCLGEFGRGQQRMLVFSGLSWASQALVMLSVVFTCQDAVRAAQWQCVDPLDAHCAALLSARDGSRAGFCELQSQQWEWTQPECTLTATFNLTCGQAWKVDVATAAYFAGFFFGSVLFGWISDNHGRRICLVLSNVATAAAAAGTALSINFGAYALMRAVAGFASSGMPIAAILLGTEAIASSWRGRAGVMSQMMFNVGVWTLPLLAYVLQDWRMLNLAIAACCLITALLAASLPESPRWLLVSGRADEVHEVLQWLAAANGTQWPQDLHVETAGSKQQAQRAAGAVLYSAQGSGGSMCLTMSADMTAYVGHTDDAQIQYTHASGPKKQSQHPNQQLSRQQEGGQGSNSNTSSEATEQARAWWLLSRHPRMRHYLAATSLVMLIMATSYYVLSLAVDRLAGSLYVNFFIVSLAELPCQMLGLWAVDVPHIGRRGTVLCGLLSTGISCVACGLLPAGRLQVVLATLGKGACAAAWTVAYIYAQELFPVTICASAMAGTNQASRLGGVLAPVLMEYASSKAGGRGLPFAAVGLITLLAAAVVGPLPETRGTRTPDTVEVSDAAVRLGTDADADPDDPDAPGGVHLMSGAMASMKHMVSGWRLRSDQARKWQALPVKDVATEFSITNSSQRVASS